MSTTAVSPLLLLVAWALVSTRLMCGRCGLPCWCDDDDEVDGRPAGCAGAAAVEWCDDADDEDDCEADDDDRDRPVVDRDSVGCSDDMDLRLPSGWAPVGRIAREGHQQRLQGRTSHARAQASERAT